MSTIDYLENRYLLGATGARRGGTLNVTGTDAGDAVFILLIREKIDVSINDGTLVRFRPEAVRKINIICNDGPDSVIIASDIRGVFVDGGAGNDRITGGEGGDILIGGEGKDRVVGGNGDDILFGAESVDTLFGGSGNDTLDGGDAADLLYGEAGEDLFRAFDGRIDALDGGADFDTAHLDDDDRFTFVENRIYRPE